MKIALIPPIPNLQHADHNDGMHLLLAHLMGDRRYVHFYQQMRIAGHYLIMDNGAHELGAALSHEQILGMARRVLAQEIVLPDVLFDRHGTIERTKRMLKWIVKEGWEEYDSAKRPRLMMVPQGKDSPDWAQCVKGLVKTWETFAPQAPELLQPPILGISKDYDENRGGLPNLIGNYIEPLRESFEFDTHCLGWPSKLWSLARVAHDFPWIRSTDSARPYVYAKHGILLEPGGQVPSYPRRDTLYFEEFLPAWKLEIARKNTLVFRATATDELMHSAVVV